MPGRAIRRPWRGQPPGLAPVSRELGGDALVWTATERQIIRGSESWLQSSEGSSNGLSGTALGRAASWSRVASAGVDFGLIQPLPFTAASGITIAVVAAPVASASLPKTVISFRSGTGSVEQTNLIFNLTAGFSPSSGYVTLYNRNTAGTPTGVDAISQIDGALHCWVIGNSASAGYLYRDGENQTLNSSARASGTLVSTAQKLRIGNIGDYTADGTYVNPDPLLLVIAWPRLLPPEEAKAWSGRLIRNIGEAFEPQSIPVYVAGAGVGSYTLNLESGNYNITGSDATLLHGYLHNLESGSYTLSGADATLLKNSLLNLESGSYTISGSDITFELAKVMNMESESYALTGADTTFVRSYQLNMESGSYVLSGQDVTFVYSGASNTVTIKAGSWLRYRTIQ